MTFFPILWTFTFLCRSCVTSEAILALQSEVSRLKKDLEVGLVQLPHLAQKMDYLTSKYRQERQERRSRTRTYQSPACNRWDSDHHGQWMKDGHFVRCYHVDSDMYYI